MSRPHIAIATNNGDIGGGEVMLLNIAESLRELGMRVLILAPTSPSELLDAARGRRFETVELRASSRAGYLLTLARWRLRHRKLPLWCNGLVPTLATTSMGPRIAHLHILPVGLHAVAARIGRTGARRVLVPSAFMASRTRGTTVLENWTEDITSGTRRREPSGPLRVGFLGRLTRDKGVHVLARAMQHVVETSHHEVRLVLAGENRFGDADDDREICAALAPLGDHVERWGWVERERFFDEVDLAVFPSVWDEPFGLVVAEAMASGVPFVISDAGALPDVAGPEHPWSARAGDVDSLASAILRALASTHDGSAQEAISRARERWMLTYSPQAGTRRVVSLLRSLTEAGALSDGVEGKRG